MQGRLEMRVGSEMPSALTDASDKVGKLLAEFGVGDRARYATELAIEELGTNIFKYAFPKEETASFTLRAAVDADSIQLVFEDQGIPFDPVSYSASAHPSSISEATIGGLGIHMV